METFAWKLETIKNGCLETLKKRCWKLEKYENDTCKRNWKRLKKSLERFRGPLSILMNRSCYLLMLSSNIITNVWQGYGILTIPAFPSYERVAGP